MVVIVGRGLAGTARLITVAAVRAGWMTRLLRVGARVVRWRGVRAGITRRVCASRTTRKLRHPGNRGPDLFDHVGDGADVGVFVWPAADEDGAAEVIVAAHVGV